VALAWFKDAGLTLPITTTTPKWACLPLAGGTKTTSLWLGDAYTCFVAQPITSGDTTVYLSQTTELHAPGTIIIGTDTISYTGIVGSTITGCSGISFSHTIGTIAYPQLVYSSSGNIQISVSGMSNGPILLSLAIPFGSYGPAGVPLLLSNTFINAGVAGALQINLQFSSNQGIQAEYNNLGLITSALTAPNVSGHVQPLAYLNVQVRDQGLVQRLRLLPSNRQVQPNLEGFTWGVYRWRDDTNDNAQAIVPTQWNTDTSLIQQYFIDGVGSIGETQDLQPIDIEEQNSSIYLRIQRGQYFTAAQRYYFPSGESFNLEFLPCSTGGTIAYTLQYAPRPQTPIFVGTWQLDSQGFYKYSMNAEYTFGSNFNPVGSTPQFTVDRNAKLLTINTAVQQPQNTILLGLLTGDSIEQFNFPIYPIESIASLYAANPTIPITNYTADYDNGFVTFPKVLLTSQYQAVYAVVNPAIAVLYEVDSTDTSEIENTNNPDESVLTKDTRLLNTIDLNPAFSGLSTGYVYLQHREIEPESVVLSCDKPQIAVPATLSSIIGLVAYGPVYYNGDYALLTGTAYGTLPGEVVPGVELQVIPGGIDPQTGTPLQTTTFRGLVNGLDPNTNTIIVETGGDGTANLVFQPAPNFGYYIPTSGPWVSTTTITNDTLSLPVPIPISQLWNSTEGWFAYVYSVLSNNPLFGLSGGNPSLGQLPFSTNGVTSGNITITHSAWTNNIVTFTLASAPTGLVVGQNIVVSGCSNVALNGFQNVASIYQTLSTWYITTSTTLSGTSSESESATFAYSNFRTNGLLEIWDNGDNPTSPIYAYDQFGNNYTDVGFTGNVVKLIYNSSLPNYGNSYLQAYFLQFLEREIIQLQVVGTNIYSNSIMIQMSAPNQVLADPYLILSTDQTVHPYYTGANANSRMNINRLGITP
jgi:hypothetical protein